jgi:hypothetical protein
MNILLAFAPFIAFALVHRFADATTGLATAALVSGALIVRDAMSRERKIKMLEVGTLILFAGLLLYSLLWKVDWTIIGARLCVDSGLLAIVFISMAIGLPFTLQYAREKVSRDSWNQPEFLRVNYVITAVWALAFAILAGADLLMLYVPAVPMRVGIWVTILAIFGAYRFTEWYPSRKT